MKVTFWGVRGSVPCPGPDTVRYGGNTSCIEVRTASGALVILDAGTGIRALGDRLADEREMTLLVSHAHWDHIEGLAFFKPVYNPEVTVRMMAAAPDGGSPRDMLLRPFKKPTFPVSPEQMQGLKAVEALPDGPFDVGGARIEWRQVNHPDFTSGLRLTETGRSVVYYTDNEISNETAATFDELAAFARGAELLIQDTMFLPEEMAAHVGWGHSSYEEGVRLAAAAGVKTLALFHHSPGRTDDEMDAVLAAARAFAATVPDGPEVLAAREGLTLEV